MVVGRGGGGPAKRRRTEDNPTASSIAQANAALQRFANRRHNRWMQELDVVAPSSSELLAPAARRAFSGPTLSTSTEAETGTRTTSKDGIDPVSVGPVDATAGLVRTSSPQALQPLNSVGTSCQPNFPGSPPSGGKPPLEPEEQGSLPSPPPSDQTANSPKLQVNHSPQVLSLGRAKSAPSPLAFSTPSVASHGHPLPSSTQHNIPTASRHHTSGYHSQSPVHTVPTPSSVSPTAQPTARSPDHLQQRHPHATSPLQQGDSQVAPPCIQTIFSHESLLHRLHEFWRSLTRGRLGQDIDDRRLTVLKAAINDQDLFFIVLNQLYCINSCKPMSLPPQLSGLAVGAMEAVAKLLCSNAMISAHVCQWFANFPAPIEQIYASSMRQMYEGLVRQVAGFLTRMPFQLDTLTNICRTRGAPPLCQEMIERLQLYSPVLQTTTFRTILRSLVPSANRCESILEEFHRLEQQTFYQLGLRAQKPGQVLQAWSAYRSIVLLWHEHLARRQDPTRFALPVEMYNSIVATLSISTAGQYPHTLHVSGPNANVIGSVPSTPQTPLGSHNMQHNQSRPLATNGFLQGAPRHLQVAALRSQPTSLEQARHGSILPVATHTPNGTGSLQSPSQPALVGRSPTVYQGQPHWPLPLFPREGAPPAPQPTCPNTAYMALHQAHLRSPLLVHKVNPTEGTSSRLYRHVIDFALHPTPLQDIPVQEVAFEVSTEDFARLPAVECSGHIGGRPLAKVDGNSITFRLRSSVNPVNGFPTEHDWIVAENVWPINLYLVLNGTHLEERRKLHHGRCLTIDVGSALVEGKNTLTVCVTRRAGEVRDMEFVIGVEVVGFTTHHSIINGIRHLSAEDSLSAIKARLSGSASFEHSDDDEIAVTSSNLTIKLFDPFSAAKMFDTPVRGSACAHQECFDLETFLGHCKRPRPDAPTVVDCWRCPWCRGDVRPQTLIIDDFLVQVRSKLEAENLLHTEAIVVEADGTWKPAAKEKRRIRSASARQEGVSEENRGAEKVVEIVELD